MGECDPVRLWMCVRELWAALPPQAFFYAEVQNRVELEAVLSEAVPAYSWMAISGFGSGVPGGAPGPGGYL